jgi:hypothetical protein
MKKRSPRPFSRAFLGFFLVGLEEAQPAALGLGVQPGYRFAQCQGLVLVEAEASGDHNRPQGQDRSPVDGDGLCHVGLKRRKAEVWTNTSRASQAAPTPCSCLRFVSMLLFAL